MNWLDRSIAFVSPSFAAKRLRARAALAHLEPFLQRAYEGAKSGRRTAGWIAGATSANTEIGGAIMKLRARSRDLIRNNPYAVRAIKALVAHSVGIGIAAEFKEKAPARLWKLWTKEADFYGEQNYHALQALAVNAAYESGECLIVRIRIRSNETGPSGVPLRLKVLEPDYLDHTKHGPMPGGNVAISGIEFDPTGRRVAYHLFTQHPGDAALFHPRLFSVRIPAEDVIHLYEKTRPGQVRGVPRLAVSMMRLRDLDEYQDALLVKKKIEACFTAFVTTDDDNKAIAAVEQENTDGSSGAPRRLERVSPGLIHYLKDGETVDFGIPSPTAGTGDFSDDNLHAIAVGAGVTYEQLTGDLSQTNYSSMRAGRGEFKNLIEQFRWLCFIPAACERVESWFVEAAYLAGLLRTRDYAATWTPPRWEYVDPLTDVKTDQLELGLGVTSLSDQIRKRGNDPDEVLAERAKDSEALKKLGLAMPVLPGAAGVQTSATDGSTDPNAGGGEADDGTPAEGEAAKPAPKGKARGVSVTLNQLDKSSAEALTAATDGLARATEKMNADNLAGAELLRQAASDIGDTARNVEATQGALLSAVSQLTKVVGAERVLTLDPKTGKPTGSRIVS